MIKMSLLFPTLQQGLFTMSHIGDIFISTRCTAGAQRFLSFSLLDPMVLRWRNYTTCNPSEESELLCCHPVSIRQLRRKVAALAIACQDGASPPLACADFAALFSSSFISPIRPSLIAVLFFTSRVNEVQPNTRA